MARPSGAKNTIPSKRDQRRLLRNLRVQADEGNLQAAGFLVILSTLRNLGKQLNGAAHE